MPNRVYTIRYVYRKKMKKTRRDANLCIVCVSVCVCVLVAVVCVRVRDTISIHLYGRLTLKMDKT